MERNVDLNEITDGKLYGLNDMVKAGCDDCSGCSACCRGMGSSIVLDPLDVFRLMQCEKCTFEELLKDKIELNIVDGLILPNLKMAENTGACAFLNEAGRCSIHPYRPGICRIFPLGRLYEDGSFKYILQVNECKKSNRTEVKVGKWIDTPQLITNQQYINTWHYFLKDMGALLKQADSSEVTKQLTMYVLNLFFVTPYDLEQDFYGQFDIRIAQAKNVVERLEGC